VCNQAAKLRYMSGGQAAIPITFRSVCGAIGSAAAQQTLIEACKKYLNDHPGLVTIRKSPAYFSR